MNIHTEQFLIPGNAGQLQCAVNHPDPDLFPAPTGLALVAHPHPLFGGTMENKVAQTLARTFVSLGYVTVRMNFRGVGQSAGEFDQGIGETEDMLALADHARRELDNLPILLAGFSFGGYVQTRVLEQLEAQRLVLVAPAVSRTA